MVNFKLFCKVCGEEFKSSNPNAEVCHSCSGSVEGKKISDISEQFRTATEGEKPSKLEEIRVIGSALITISLLGYVFYLMVSA